MCIPDIGGRGGGEVFLLQGVDIFAESRVLSLGEGQRAQEMIHGDRLNFSLTPEQRLTLPCVAPAPEEDGGIVVLSTRSIFTHPRSAAGPVGEGGGGGSVCTRNRC